MEGVEVVECADFGRGSLEIHGVRWCKTERRANIVSGILNGRTLLYLLMLFGVEL